MTKTDKYYKREEIKEELRLIEISERDYITPTAKVYAKLSEDKYYLKRNFINNSCGYLYVSIKLKNGKQVQRRVHRLLAQAYIPNPNNLSVVMHLDNNKSNISLDNLKWGTIQENTQQAYDDGLAINAKSYDDSQSIPIYMYDSITCEIINDFGSASELERELGISKRSALASCKMKPKNIRKSYFFRFQDDCDICPPNLVGVYDFDTDKLLYLCYSVLDASNKSNIKVKTIQEELRKARKPKTKTRQIYFNKIIRQ